MTLRPIIRSLFFHGALLLALVLVFVMVINTSPFDQKPLPEIHQFADDELNLDDTGNSYPALLALNVGADSDPWTAGSEMIRRLRQKSESGEPISLSEAEHMAVFGEADADAWRDDFLELGCNPRVSHTCFDSLRAELAQKTTDGWAADHRLNLLLERYRRIVQMPRFVEFSEADLTTRLPPYQIMMQLARLALIQASLGSDTMQGQQRFLAALGQDMRFWRLMLRDGQTLIAKMVAVAGLRTDILYLSGYLRTTKPDGIDSQQIDELTRPLSAEEWDIGEAFLAEQHFYFHEIAGLDHGLMSLIVQENATKNEYFRSRTLPLLLLSKMSAAEFFAAPRDAEPPSHVGVFPPTLYNLGGKLLLDVSAPQYDEYIGRVHDLVGMIDLAKAQWLTLDQPGPSITNAIAATGLGNPFTGKPFELDPNGELLGFQCFAQTDSCELKIR